MPRLSDARKNKRPEQTKFEEEQQRSIDQDQLESGAEYTRLLDESDPDVPDSDVPDSDVPDSDEPFPSSVKFVNDQCAVVTCTRELSVKTWRNYLVKNWKMFTEGLKEIKLLIICGVHGDKSGNWHGDAQNVDDCKKQAVSLPYFLNRD